MALRPVLVRLQGCCEHLLSFTDVRQVHPDDRQQLQQYPALDFQVRMHSISQASYLTGR